MKKNITYSLLLAGLMVVLSGCVIKERPPGHPHHPHWHPQNKAEKHCWHEGYKPGTEEFQICVKKYQEGLMWKKERQEEIREDKLRRQKEEQERLMEKKARQEKAQQERLMEKKVHQEKQMQKKAWQQKSIPEKKAKQKVIIKKKK